MNWYVFIIISKNDGKINRTAVAQGLSVREARAMTNLDHQWEKIAVEVCCGKDMPGVGVPGMWSMGEEYAAG